LLPAGKGSHIELGIAFGRGKKVYLYPAHEEFNNIETTSTFYRSVTGCKTPTSRINEA